MIFYEKFGTTTISPEFAEWMMGYEQRFTELIPTPISSDCYGGNRTRMWKGSSQFVQVEREREREPGIRRSAQHHGRRNPVGQSWADEPGVGRVAHGIPNRVDRIKCLGNAVVPQQFYPFFAAIAEIEREQE